MGTQYDKGGAQDLAHRIAEGVLKGAIPTVRRLRDAGGRAHIRRPLTCHPRFSFFPVVQCPKCEKGVLSYEDGAYLCRHKATEWSRCAPPTHRRHGRVVSCCRYVDLKNFC